MTVISSKKDVEALSLIVVAEFDADVDRVWQVWEDARLLERWWGPPTYPATFHQHEAVVGSTSKYYMTGPEGERLHGWWKITAVESPHRFEFDDGFADENGEPLDDGRTTHGAALIESSGDGRTRMTITSTFPSAEVLEELSAMGMEEGMREALGQVDAVLAESVGS